MKLHSHIKWHRRYCIIDWDKAVLFVASKFDGRYRDYIKLLPNILINEVEPCHDNIIELNAESERFFLE